MGAVWWSALEAEHVTIEAEHRATRGDHYGTVQTACPLCVPAEPVAAGQLELEGGPELCEHLIPRAECRLVEHG